MSVSSRMPASELHETQTAKKSIIVTLSEVQSGNIVLGADVRVFGIEGNWEVVAQD